MENTEREFIEKRISKDMEELERMNRKESNDKVAEQLHDLYQSLVDKGFSEEQAFYIFYEAIKIAWHSA